MALVKNMLLKERESGRVYRLLDQVASSETPDKAPTHAVLIDIHAKCATPFVLGRGKVLDRLADRDFVVLDETRELINLQNLSEPELKVVNRRWELVQALLPHGARIYDKAFRGAEAARLADAKIASKPFFYTTLRLYLQRGGGKASVVTDFANCGRPGEVRIALEGAPKPGRPRTFQPGIGVASTEFHRKNMRIAWTRAPVGTDGRGLREAYDWMLIKRYADFVKVTDGKRRKVAVENYDAVPTFEQFRYLWSVEHPFELRQLKRLQQRRFELAFKPLLKGTLGEVRGPGTRYYIDATVLDVYCVSRANPNRIVGRPTLYVVVDQFSRMIVGMYVGLEPPCWAGAMLALWNCNLDKVDFCAAYGIEITADQWPIGCMPMHLMGDRGELTSAQADALVEGFGVDVENARPYAGEAKGVAERVFGTLQTKFGPYLPGYVDKEFSGRDAEPAALRGALDIHQVTAVMINAVLHTNLRVIREYDGWPEVIAAGVPFVPVALWHWGVENLQCDCRPFDPGYLKLYLWPQKDMKLTRKALQFYRGLYYMGVDLGAQPWFAESFFKRDTLTALYHPLDISRAVVLPTDARTGAFEVQLTGRSAKWANMAFCEVTALEDQQKRTNAEARWKNLNTQLAHTAQVHDTVKQGRKRLAEQRDPSLSKAGRLKDIRRNKGDEIDAMTDEALVATFGHDPTGEVVDVEATEVPDQQTRTLGTVQALIDARTRALRGPQD